MAIVIPSSTSGLPLPLPTWAPISSSFYSRCPWYGRWSSRSAVSLACRFYSLLVSCELYNPPIFFITHFFFFFSKYEISNLPPFPTFFVFSVCIISAIRIRMIQSASRGDFAEALPYSHIWSFLEPTIAICTSCLPMARPVFGKYLPSLPHRSKSSETSEHQLVRNRAWLMWWKFLLWEKKSGVLFYDERFFLLDGQQTGKEDYEMEHYPGVLTFRTSI